MREPEIADSVDELVRKHIAPDAHLHFASTMARPNALLHAVARTLRGSGALTVSMAAVHSSAHALALSGAVRRMITCFLGETYPTPRPCRLYRHVGRKDPFELESWSLLTQVQRLMAAAMGQPGTATTALLGTVLAEGKQDDLVPLPATRHREHAALLSPLRPDLTLVHGAVADRRGNVVIRPPYGEGAWPAYAARHGVLASVERIVDDSVIDDRPGDVLIPGSRVVGLCEAPHGAHPQSLRTDGIAGVRGYPDDYEFLSMTAAACSDPDSAREWFHDWIDLAGHRAYLEKLGKPRLNALVGPQQHAAGTAGTGLPESRGASTRAERLIVLAAREITRQVREHGYDTLLAGIGASHLAAWLAAARLRESGRRIKLVAELGFYGTTPCDGDVFLFSQHHAENSEQLTGVAEVLGGMVASNDHCLGVLAGAEIDTRGDINTSILPDGRWITGSGGAHDIASSTDCVVVSASGKRRFVPRVATVTSPGDRVRAVVCEFGTFHRPTRWEPFRLSTYLADEDHPEPRSAVAERTCWKSDTSTAENEREITAAELTTLRRLDPEGHYR